MASFTLQRVAQADLQLKMRQMEVHDWHAKKIRKINADFQGRIEEQLGVAIDSDDLYEYLHDGVLLCQLANKIKPGSVKNVKKWKNNSVYMDNVGNFLKLYVGYGSFSLGVI